ncbi:tetratricopeptide repeat protein [Streptomyces europaeiscabiei]|uniref:tetratricopeptide repeat protein n=1 Tax=Streptomyces europaeiscabiei TaxID=146819 RepID=UPI002E190C64
MEFERRVQIRVRRPESAKREFGSGYLIAPRLVLTAAHVLNGVSETGQGSVTVYRPDAGEGEFPATVRWRRKDGAVDAALVEVDHNHGWQAPESLADSLIRPPQRWGRLIGTRPHPVALAGFPRMQKDPADGRRLDEQLTGHINPGTGSLADRYEVSATDPTIPVELPPGSKSSRWSGISGAAVLSDGLYTDDVLCGVIRRDRQADGGTRLTATPAALLLADHDFHTLITEHTGWEPVLEAVEPAGLLTPAVSERYLDSPAALLRADAEAVTFHDRTSELADLYTWCQTGPANISVWVMTGPGGQGKTRLARHLTDTLSREGWATGHLRPDLTDHDTQPDFAPLATALPLLLVVDYAETRPRLLRRMITHLQASRHRVRLLLLARSDGEWRTDALNAAPRTRSLLKTAPVTELAPLIPRGRPIQERTTAFTRAAHDLARLLPAVPSVPAHDWAALAATLRPFDDLSHARYDNALTLQLAALVTLLQHGPAPAVPPPGAPAEEILLEHEERFWEDSATAPAFKLSLPTPTLAAAVAVAALCGATSKEEALRAIGEVPGLPANNVPRTAAWLATLYPADPHRYWGSLQPDRIAEYHAARTLTRDDLPLPALLAAASPGQQTQTITVLARAAIAHYNTGRTTDSDHLLHTLDTALDTTPLAYESIRTAAGALPYPSRITAPLALRLTTTLTQAGRHLAGADPATFEPDLAGSLSNLGVRLSAVGRHGEALTATEEAVIAYRRLAEADPAAFEPNLTGSLSNLGGNLSAVGRHGEALTATEEAVIAYRRLAGVDPATFEPDLATSLSNLGIRLSAVGRHDEALTATEESVKIRRRLAGADPAAFEPDLATSLSNLGIRLSAVGRRAEALTATEEAVKIRRRLAGADPAAFEPDLAGSLSNLGVRLSAVGRRGEALTATEEAVKIQRRLAEADPATFEPDLAGSLSNLGVRLSAVGRRREALKPTEEAVITYRRLAEADPTTFEPNLATSLSNLGIRLSTVGRHGEALKPTEEAVITYRRLAEADPTTFEPNLAGSLSNLGGNLSAVGRHGGALTATEESVKIRRRLAGADPATFEPDLAGSLSNLGVRLSAVGRRGEALTATKEAVITYRRLAEADPTTFEPNLATSLSNLGDWLSAVGRRREALKPTEEAVKIRRRLAEADPAAFEPDLATSLSNLGEDLSAVGRRGEALTATEEAVKIQRRLAEADPAAFEPNLARSLSAWAWVRFEARQDLSEALRATEEAIELYRKLVAIVPARFASPLRDVLGLQADLLLSLRRLR